MTHATQTLATFVRQLAAARTEAAELSEDTLEQLSHLRPVRLRRDEGPDRFGFIPEEVAEVLPELVERDAAGSPDRLDDASLSALLLALVQHQHRCHREAVAHLETQVQELGDRLTAIDGGRASTRLVS